MRRASPLPLFSILFFVPSSFPSSFLWPRNRSQRIILRCISVPKTRLKEKGGQPKEACWKSHERGCQCAPSEDVFFWHLSPKEAWHAAGLPSAVCTASQGAILHSLMIFQLEITSHLICDNVPHCVLTCKHTRWHKHCYAHPTEIVKYSGRQWKQQRNRWCSCATCHILLTLH